MCDYNSINKFVSKSKTKCLALCETGENLLIIKFINFL